MDRATVVGEIISRMVKGSPEPSLSLRAAAAEESRKRSPLPFPRRELRCKAQNRHMQAKCGIYISCMNPFTYTDYLETKYSLSSILNGSKVDSPQLRGTKEILWTLDVAGWEKIYFSK